MPELENDTNSFSVDMHFAVPADFKTTYATGVLVSAMPSGTINLSFYIDRPPIPDSVTFRLTSDGKMQEANKNVRSGMSRDFQNAVIIDEQTAVSIAEALQRVVKAMADQSAPTNTPSNQ